MAVIIVEPDHGGDRRVIGPFASGEAATAYGFAHAVDWAGCDWYWLPLDPPTA